MKGMGRGCKVASRRTWPQYVARAAISLERKARTKGAHPIAESKACAALETACEHGIDAWGVIDFVVVLTLLAGVFYAVSAPCRDFQQG